MKRVLFLLTAICLGIGTIAAQSAKVTGRVTDTEGEAVIGASVYVIGTNLGANTDLEGNFTIENVPSSATTLRVSYIGMTTQEVHILKGKAMKVVLVEDGVSLDEVMVVAYGTAKKSAFTGSASVVKSETLEQRQVSDVTKALSGTIAGVQTLSSNGQPGTSATVRVRGVGSLYAVNSPLYVVDGIPFDGDISSINTADIESMSVLKDAAAAALYGARGANGVIMITTKRGNNNGARISFDARWGINERQIGKYDVLTSTNQYMETLYQAQRNAAFYTQGKNAEQAHNAANNGLFKALGYQIYTLNGADGLIGLDGKVNPLATLGYSDGKHYFTPDDWTKGTIDNQMRQEYNVSVAGGSDKINYYFSAGYLQDGGVIENSGFDRLSTRLSVDYQAKKWLKIGANLAYNNHESRYPGEQTSTNSSGNAFLLANMIAPVYPMYVRDAEGKIVMDAQTGSKVYDYGNGQTGYTRNWMSMSNPMSDLYYNTEEYLMDIFNGKWYAEVTPLKGLKLTASLGTFIDNTRYHSVGNNKYGQSASYGGSVTQENTRTNAFNQQYLANYEWSIDKNNFDIMVGYEAYDLRGEDSWATGQNYYKSGDWTVDNTIDQKRGGGSAYEYSTRGIFGRLNWNWNEKYFLSGSYRRDASSRFHPDNRWGNFFSASAAWVISKEAFMKDVEWVDMLKVKASFGQQGNDKLGTSSVYYYAYLDQYKMTGADGTFSDGLLSYKGNKDITWEKSNAFNIGADFSLFRGKIDGTIEYFSRTTSDMLYSKPVANSNGYGSIPMNIGSMTNSGVEIELNASIINRRNFKWNVYGNATFVKNEINELHPELNGEYISGTEILREGDSMYQLYLVNYLGVDPNTGLALYEAKTKADDYFKKTMTPEAYTELTKEGNEKAYNAAVEAYNKNPEKYATSDWSIANSTGREATGDLMPDVYGGFGTTIEFHGFDFGIQFAYQLGGKIWDYTYQDLMHGGATADAGQNWHKDIANAWTPENRNTSIPRLNSDDKYTNASSNRWLISSNYLSINNITLGYTLPKNFTRSLGLTSVRIYGAADNVALFSARKGMDPRQGYTSSTNATYGALRTISGGIKVTF